VHFACGGLEVDVIVRDDAGEPLDDAPHLDRRRRRGAAGAPPIVLRDFRRH
jgi:hypothetical protein